MNFSKMEECCVPRCFAKTRDPAVLLYDFPTSPDMTAKWIMSINLFLNNGGTWFPQTKAKICSRHFLPDDFKSDIKADGIKQSLKPRSVPTVFEFETSNITKRYQSQPAKSPLIVKVAKPFGGNLVKQKVTESNLMAHEGTSYSLQPSLSMSSTVSVQNQIISAARSLPSASSNVLQTVGLSPLTSPIISAPLPCAPSSTTVPTIPLVSVVPVTPILNSESDKCVLPKRPILTENINAKPVEPAPKRIKPSTSRSKNTSDLIEIGPSTFLKINPNVIKVTKKVTPSGNTVLQFVMNPSLAGLVGKKPIFSLNNKPKPPKVTSSEDASKSNTSGTTADASGTDKDASQNAEKPTVNGLDASDTNAVNLDSGSEGEAPVLLSTNLPIRSPYLFDKRRYSSQLRTKSREIMRLKARVANLLKKVEELENKCVVQDRQLSFSSIKKLRSIKKNAEKGEAHANFILEQVRGYFGAAAFRWSDTTLTQCSVWCRKAPYAYEYFKKADLFRLPCLATVKRFMNKHPEVMLQIKNKTLGRYSIDEDDSSSDFDFDESENEGAVDNDQEDTSDICQQTMTIENGSAEDSMDINKADPSSSTAVNISVPGSQEETRQAVLSLWQNVNDSNKVAQNSSISTTSNETVVKATVPTDTTATLSDGTTSAINIQAMETSSNKVIVQNLSAEQLKTLLESDSSTTDTISAINLNGQEIILQPGNIIQLNSEDGNETGLSYYIVPAADDQIIATDHEYTITHENDDTGVTQQILYITEPANVSDGVTISLKN